MFRKRDFRSIKDSKITIAGISFLVGILIGWPYFHYKEKYSETDFIASVNSVRETSGNYKFISPLLAYETPEDNLDQYKPIKEQVARYINGQKDLGNIDDASLYLRVGTDWIGVNEIDNYTPASLFKVPLLIGYYKVAESDPTVLDKQITLDNTSHDGNETIKADAYAQPGGQYTVRQLLDFMIKDSDNNATYALFNNIDKTSFSKIFSDLNITLPDTIETGDFITPKDYAFLFRVLVNATYLNRDYSEKALALLSQTDFNGGLVAGVPSGTTVSHKFGEYALVENGQVTKRELHDCGVVYGGQKNYVICVMTKGQDFNKLQNTIKQVSAIVYQGINK